MNTSKSENENKNQSDTETSHQLKVSTRFMETFEVVRPIKPGSDFGLFLNDEGNLDIVPIIHSINDNREIIDNISIGIAKGIFKNENEITDSLNKEEYEVVSIGQALDSKAL
jgi:hypothetical protein